MFNKCESLFERYRNAKKYNCKLFNQKIEIEFDIAFIRIDININKRFDK